MPRVSLFKLLDEAIIPASCVFGGKLFGLFLASLVFDLAWQPAKDFYSPTLFLDFSTPQGALLANDIATLLMFVALSLGFGWVVYRAHYFNLSHLHPHQAKKHLASQNETFLTDSREIYHQAVVWAALNWLVFLGAYLDFLTGNLSALVFSLGLVVSGTMLVSLAKNVKHEVKLSRSLAGNR
jgi:hypothetical protein